MSNHAAAPAPTLGEAQRRALAIAESERWRIVAEGADGQRVTLRAGRRRRVLVLRLGPPEQGIPDE